MCLSLVSQLAVCRGPQPPRATSLQQLCALSQTARATRAIVTGYEAQHSEIKIISGTSYGDSRVAQSV
jgi:hypothetical protein